MSVVLLGMVADAMAFHTALRTAEAARPAGLADIHALLGARQPTSTTAVITGGRVVAGETYRGENRYGDGTVPNVGAARADVPLDSNTLHHVADMHGNLQCTKAVLTMLTELITNRPVVVRGPGDVRLRLSVRDLIVTGEDLTVRVDLDGDARRAVTITATHENGRQPVIRTPRVHDQRVTTTLSGLRPAPSRSSHPDRRPSRRSPPARSSGMAPEVTPGRPLEAWLQKPQSFAVALNDSWSCPTM